MKDSRFWGTRLEHLENVTPKQIVEHYNKINDNENKDMAATQIFQLKDEKKYDAFFYVKHRFAEVKGIDAPDNKKELPTTPSTAK
jgi:hypothetical protein